MWQLYWSAFTEKSWSQIEFAGDYISICHQDKQYSKPWTLPITHCRCACHLKQGRVVTVINSVLGISSWDIKNNGRSWDSRYNYHRLFYFLLALKTIDMLNWMGKGPGGLDLIQKLRNDDSGRNSFPLGRKYQLTLQY